MGMGIKELRMGGDGNFVLEKLPHNVIRVKFT